MLDFNPHNRKREYERTKNPLIVWETVLECCKEKKGFPDWVIDYLEDVAEEMVNLDPPKGKAAAQVRDALGLGDGKIDKPFANYKKFYNRDSKTDFEFKWMVYQWVEYNLPPDGKGKTKVYEAAARKFIKDDKPENRWKTVQKIYLEMAKVDKEVEAENKTVLNPK
jgi:hypothetical protein